MVGLTLQLIGVDIAPGMIEKARRKLQMQSCWLLTLSKLDCQRQVRMLYFLVWRCSGAIL